MPAPIRTLPAVLLEAATRHGAMPVLEDRAGTVTLNDLMADAARAAEGLRKLGVERGDKIGFYADNSRRWILTDLAIQLAGAVSVPRGTDTPAEEYAEILVHSGAGLVFADKARHVERLEAVRDQVPAMGEILRIQSEEAEGRGLDDLIADGQGGPVFATLAEAIQPDDLATIIYTSGTTGRPKGVMLTQANFAHQAWCCPGVFDLGRSEEDAFLSVLPPWHIFERSVEYIAIAGGARVIYTNRRRFKEDLARCHPTFVPSVPRIWETVYSGIQKTLDHGSPVKRTVFKVAYRFARIRTSMWDRARGWVLRDHEPKGPGLLVEGVKRLGALAIATVTYPFDALGKKVVFGKLKQLVGTRLRGAISGGGLMPAHIDVFFRTVELPILIGYGLTETSPVCTVRRVERNVLGTIGRVVPEVEIQIRHPETRAERPVGEIGVICTRGPHVMRGYYQDQELTDRVLDEDGWFDTGDLGWITEAGDLCFHGRLKETIVLKGGENVEPSNVEGSILPSRYIEQCIVVGQDRKVLAALVLPDRAEVCPKLGLPEDTPYEDLAKNAQLQALIRDECRTRTRHLKGFEKITRVALMHEPLDAENGLLTQTLKPRRHVIVEHFAEAIEEAYA